MATTLMIVATTAAAYKPISTLIVAFNETPDIPTPARRLAILVE